MQRAFNCASHGPAPQNGVLAIEQVGTEHVVLGLIMENTVAAARRGHPPQPQENGYLGLNITPEAAHAASAWVCGRKRKSGRGPRTPELAFSHTAKRAFEAAVQVPNVSSAPSSLLSGLNLEDVELLCRFRCLPSGGPMCHFHALGPLMQKLAMQEAARLRMEFVGPEHLAIAVLSIGDCGALRVLARYDVPKLRRSAVPRLGHYKCVLLRHSAQDVDCTTYSILRAPSHMSLLAQPYSPAPQQQQSRMTACLGWPVLKPGHASTQHASSAHRLRTVLLQAGH